jgi:hypothetical protein
MEVVRRVYNSSEQKKFRNKMNEYLDYYRNNYWDLDNEQLKPDDGQESEISVNLLFSTIATIAPLLTDNRPIWYARAREPWAQGFADRLKTITDILWTDLDMDMTVLKVCTDSLIMRFGMFKIWFDPKGRDGDGEIKIEGVDPRTFVIAPGYTDAWEAPWCGTVTARPLSWIWQTYPTKKKQIQPDKILENDLDKDGNMIERSDIEVCDRTATVYEIWIQDCEVMTEIIKNAETGEEQKVSKPKYPHGRYLVFCQGVKGKVVVLDDRPYPYHHGKPPFVPLYDYIDPHKFTGICEADQLSGLILETNYLFRKVTRHIRNWSAPNHAVEEGSGITQEQWKKDAPGGNKLFTLKSGKQPPLPIETPKLDSMALNFFNTLFGLIEEVSGVSEISKGRVTKKERQSASEIQSLIETSHTRTRQRVRNLEWSLKRLFKLVLEMMMQFYIEPNPRTYSKRADDGYEWYQVSANKQFVSSMINDYYKKAIQDAEQDKEEIARLEKEKNETLIDFNAKYLDTTSVYIPIEPEIQTNSSLPMDKQALANLALRLFEIQALDREALFEFLRLPRAEETVQRMDEKEAQAAQAQQGPPPGAPPQGPPPGM